jgi:hypothetical protein
VIAAKFVDGWKIWVNKMFLEQGRAAHGVPVPDLDDLPVGTEHHAVARHAAPALDPSNVFHGEPISLVFQRERLCGADVVEQRVARRRPDRV